MPVKIIPGASDNKLGVINVDELVKMKNDFVTETDLIPKGSRPVVVKTHHCFLYKEQVDDLFNLLPGTEILKINFSVHLNPLLECTKDYSDSLTVVIEAAMDDTGRTVKNNLGDYVLIPAYANKTASPRKAAGSGNPCCPSQGGG